jgi:hypothetical protein
LITWYESEKRRNEEGSRVSQYEVSRLKVVVSCGRKEYVKMLRLHFFGRIMYLVQLV